MRKLAVVILILTSMELTSCKNDPCEDLKSQKLVVNLAEIENAQKQLSRLKVCGFDSVDCVLAMYVVGQICTEKMISTGSLNINTKGFTVPYSEIIDQLNQFKQTSTYEEERRNIIRSKL